MKKSGLKIALVTGASKGIGKQLAIGLSKRGYTLVLVGRNEADLLKVDNFIESISSRKSYTYTVDLREQDQIIKMVEEVDQKFGRVDVLVNNAGIHAKGTLDLTPEEFGQLLDVNITGHFMMTQAVVPIMLRHGSGYIFNVASRSAKVGFAETGGYCASKWGLLGFSESLYRKLTPLGIKVTALCPAWVNTDMAQRAGSPLEPMQMIQPEDLSKTIDWLLSLSDGACVKDVLITNPRSL